MRNAVRKKNVLPPGPIMSFTLIGIMFLSGLLYYRAVKFQRFLEPALAISQPRSEFADTINSLLKREFEPNIIYGVRFTMGSIVVDQSKLLDREDMKPASDLMMKKLGRVFLSALDNDYLRSHTELVLVLARYPEDGDSETNLKMRLLMQSRAEKILQSLFGVEPLLKKKYALYFAAAAMPANPARGEADQIEFRVIPSEQLHIQVLQKLRKYMK